MLPESVTIFCTVQKRLNRTKMDHINKKIRQMRRLKVVFKRPQKRAKSPPQEINLYPSSTQTSSFICPNCSAEKADVETQTLEHVCEGLSVTDACIQVNITPTRIPRLLGSKYSGSSDSSIASPPINHDAACQTSERSHSRSENEKSSRLNTPRPSTANANLDTLRSKTSSYKYQSIVVAHNTTPVNKEKSIKCYKKLNLLSTTSQRGTNMLNKYKTTSGSEELLDVDSEDGNVLENGGSENSPTHRGSRKKQGYVRHSSSSSGIPIHVKLRSLESPKPRRIGPLKNTSYFPGTSGINSSTNSSDLSSPSGDYVKASSDEESDPSFWNAEGHYSLLSETYTLEGAGDFLENDILKVPDIGTQKHDVSTTSSGSGIRPPKVFLSGKAPDNDDGSKAHSSTPTYETLDEFSLQNNSE